ncbi:hypothetical protein B0H63DRAFT_528119 [Podospora didyma]|uniref:Uncharacterized protein n=1 Tax=Podospora didyma TaxID=330526 RepID=A0AAE0K5B5_9PEZI|nr:hypothetical protein B0H63DRAFT_528119 [Podospora didyma]
MASQQPVNKRIADVEDPAGAARRKKRAKRVKVNKKPPTALDALRQQIRSTSDTAYDVATLRELPDIAIELGAALDLANGSTAFFQPHGGTGFFGDALAKLEADDPLWLPPPDHTERDPDCHFVSCTRQHTYLLLGTPKFLRNDKHPNLHKWHARLANQETAQLPTHVNFSRGGGWFNNAIYQYQDGKPDWACTVSDSRELEASKVLDSELATAVFLMKMTLQVKIAEPIPKPIITIRQSAAAKMPQEWDDPIVLSILRWIFSTPTSLGRSNPASSSGRSSPAAATPPPDAIAQ